MFPARSLFLSAALACVSTCTCEEPAPPPVRLDEILGPGQVRCGPVTRDSELIGGPQAFGVVGRSFRCNNSKIRFLIQDGTRPVGVSSRGGNLVDVDLVRADELADGEDTFREHVSAIGGREILPEKITVVNDGTNGEPGIVRIEGPPVDLS